MSDETQDIAETTEPAPQEVLDTPADDTPPAPSWTEDDAEEARAFGWKAPDEWKGEVPTGYIDDPRRYMERAEKFTPFRKLAEKQAQLERDFAERTRKLEAIAESTLKSQQERHKQELARITAEQRRAVDLADVDAYDRLEVEKQRLAAPVNPPQQPQIDPYVQEYTKANEWVNNPILRDAGAKLIDANPAIASADAKTQILYAEAELRKIYPTAFPQAASPTPATQQQPQTRRVDAGGLAGGSTSGFSKLPSEAKSAFERFAAEGIFENNEAGRKAYADEYNRA